MNLKYIGAMLLMAGLPSIASAQQTLEQATDSVKNILEQAKKGDAEMQNEVGTWYYTGRHVNKNYDEALKWWGRAAKQGHVDAIGNMGLCYQYGRGAEKDSLTAMNLLRTSINKGNKRMLPNQEEAAAKGNVFSNVFVATVYRDGVGVAKDKAKAISYFTSAAEKGSRDAQRELSLIMLNSKRPAEAAKWLKMASDQGESVCTYYYGRLLMDGSGVKQDKKAGANYLLKAAEEGFVPAKEAVADCYMTGNGLTKNQEQAVIWYRKAATANHPSAQWKLFRCYLDGVGTPVNYERALKWLSKSAKNNTKSVKAFLRDSIPGSPFVSYLSGLKAIKVKDWQKASKDFKAVEKAKIADGKVMQAVVLLNSDNPKNNYKKGVKMLEEAANAGDPHALYLLSALYESGKGVGKDMDMALLGFMQGVNDGYGPALCTLGDIFFEGRGVEQDYAQAVELYEAALAQGDLTANCAKRLAAALAEGKGVEAPDKKRAEEIEKGDYSDYTSLIIDMVE